MALVSEDVPGDPGANASLPYGTHTAFQQEQRALASQTGLGGSAPPPPGMAPPPSLNQPASPAQPQAQPFRGRLDMNAVFPPMPELQNMDKTPWRDQIRQQAEIFKHHPQAGPAWARFNDMISAQHGPK